MIPSDLKTEDEQIEAEINSFLEAHPKCGEFEAIFNYLRGMDISHDVAADVAKSLLWAESRAKRPNAGRFERKYSVADFLALFPDKAAGASSTGLMREAVEQIGMSRSRFWLMLREQELLKTIEKTPAGLWRRAK